MFCLRENSSLTWLPGRLPDGLTRRGDINLLLLGDPGTAKSQLLKFVEKVAPIGVSPSCCRVRLSLTRSAPWCGCIGLHLWEGKQCSRSDSFCHEGPSVGECWWLRVVAAVALSNLPSCRGTSSWRAGPWCWLMGAWCALMSLTRCAAMKQHPGQLLNPVTYPSLSLSPPPPPPHTHTDAGG